MGFVIYLVLAGSFADAQVIQEDAADPTAIRLQRFRPTGDPNGFFQTQSIESLGFLGYSTSFYLNYANAPLTFNNNKGEPIPVVGHQVGADLTIGFGMSESSNFYIHLPLTLYQSGSIPMSPLFGVLQGTQLSGFYISDLRISMRCTIIDERLFGFSLGVMSFISFPTDTGGGLEGSEASKLCNCGKKTSGLRSGFGHLRQSLVEPPAKLPPRLKNFNGTRPTSVNSMVAFSKRFTGLRLGLNVGYRFTPEVEIAGTTWSHELVYSVAFAWSLTRKWHVMVDGFGSIGLPETTVSNSPAEILAGMQFCPQEYFRINTAVGIPVSRGIGTPNFRFVLGVQFSSASCYEKKNRTRWILKKVDTSVKKQMPNKIQPKPPIRKLKLLPSVVRSVPTRIKPKPSVRPQPRPKEPPKIRPQARPIPKQRPKPRPKAALNDRDKDGIPDDKDKCPDQKGPSFQKGCPVVQMTKKQIVLLARNKIFFTTGKASIQPRSYPLLNEIAKKMLTAPKIKVRIEGHTDNQGTKTFNKLLSINRAKTVMLYLISRGVSKKRLSYKGFGMSKPLSDNKTEEHRAKNRRVEFIILR